MKKTMLALFACFAVASSAHGQDTSVVVYNANLGLVKKTIRLDLKRGTQTIPFAGVADRIDPTSIRLEAQQGTVRMLEQNFRFDTANPQSVIREYLDREISLYLEGGTAVRGTLLSAEGDVVLRDQSGKVVVVRMDAIERYEFPELPTGLVNRPTLVWTLQSDRDGTVPVRMSYLTEGLSWQAEYTAVVNAEETALEMSSLASIQNQSGERYENSALTLVAGEINRVRPPRPVPMYAAEKRTMMAEAADQAGGFEEQGLFEYHVYNLQGRTTLEDAEVKQISLFAPRTVPVEKQYVFNQNRYREDVMTVLRFANTEKGGPGVPLPAGRVRVYKAESEDATVLIGEDSLDHTPVGGDVRLAVGRAFELSGERKVMDTRSISPRVNEQQVEIVIRNRKKEAVTVTAVENLPGSWDITRRSQDFTRKDANTIEFVVKVPAGGETTVSYTVRFTY